MSKPIKCMRTTHPPKKILHIYNLLKYIIFLYTPQPSIILIWNTRQNSSGSKPQRKEPWSKICCQWRVVPRQGYTFPKQNHIWDYCRSVLNSFSDQNKVTMKHALTIQTIMGILLPNTSETAPIKGQHKNWSKENKEPRKPENDEK